jgi:S-DNA-T family DNA segregation ATPase FtsK/SpoIIIE
MVKSITVTELKCACVDEDWRRKWLKGKKPSTKNFVPPGELTVYGGVFHRIVDEFVGWLVETRRKEAITMEDGPILWDELHDRFAGDELDRISKQGNLESAYHLSQALIEFCKRLALLRSRTPSFKSWQDIYLANEFLLKNVEFRLGGASLFVSGKLDAVRFQPEIGIELVDYKLTHGSHMKHDLVQLAIYARLLELARPGLDFLGTLEYYEPKLHEVAVSREDLSALFEDKIQPILYEIVGASPTKPVASSGHSESSLPAGKPKADRQDLSAAIRSCFADFKLDVEVIDRQEAPQLIRYRVKPAPGVKVVSLANRADDLKVALSLLATPVIEPSKGSVVIDIPKEKPDTVYWREAVKRAEFTSNKSPVAFPVGVGVDNNLLVADFADPNMCHSLVAGVAGSGKSEFLKSVVAAIISRNAPSALKLTIIDPKILTFGSLPPDLQHLSEPVITDVSAAIPCLEKTVADMERRYKTMAKEGLENLSLRFSAGKTDIPYRVIVFDEFGDLILAGSEEKKEFERLVARIAQMGRAAGIHLILTTQRPDRNVVTGLIKANLPLKICMRVVNSTNSNIVLDQTGGEKLLGRGDLLCDRGCGVERAQSPYVTQEELRALTNYYKQ